MTPVTPDDNKVTYWPAAIGDRVRYSVSSGFCTQTYGGVVIELGRHDKVLVVFDPGTRMTEPRGRWIEEAYLTILGGGSDARH